MWLLTKLLTNFPENPLGGGLTSISRKAFGERQRHVRRKPPSYRGKVWHERRRCTRRAPLISLWREKWLNLALGLLLSQSRCFI